MLVDSVRDEINKVYNSYSFIHNINMCVRAHKGIYGLKEVGASANE